MPSYKTHFPSTYLEKEDLKNREFRVAIGEIATEKVGDDQKMVIYFQGAQKGMVCNRTNADTIADLYGEDTDSWIGRELILYVDPTVMYAGKRVGGVRVKAPPRRPADGGNGPRRLAQKDVGGGVTTQTTEAVTEDDMAQEIPF